MKARIILAGALAAALAVPATASAAREASGSAAKVAGGYVLGLYAIDDAKGDSLTVTINRVNAKRGQSDALVVTKGARVTVKGGNVSIKSRLGKRGVVDLRMRGAKKLRSKKPRKGCTGFAGTTWSGVLAGRLRVRLPNGKTVTIRSLRGSTAINAKLRCKGSGPGAPGGDGQGDGAGGEPQLSLHTKVGRTTTSFVAMKRSLMLTRIVDEHRERGVTISTVTSVWASGSGLLRVSGGGSGATVRSTSPFSGTGTFTATVTGDSFASGPLRGSLKVKPQGAPAVTIAGDDAILMNGDKG